MADRSLIEWTDTTWNPITGCSVVSPGCTNCYAMKLAGTRLADHPSRAGLTVDSKAGPVWNGKVRLNEAWLTQPVRWKRPRKIFVCAHNDLFHEAVPDEWIDRVVAVMALCPQHVLQVLTKRPERMRAYLTCPTLPHRIALLAVELGGPLGQDGPPKHHERAIKLGEDGRLYWPLPLPNVWLGVSVEDQVRADERIPILLDTPAAVRWISAEPLLGPIDLTVIGKRNDLGKEVALNALTGERLTGRPSLADGFFAEPWTARLDWVVPGGESGPGARPMHPDWARQLRNQCAEAAVPFLFKQWGAWIDWKQFGATAWTNTTPQRASYKGPIVGTFHGGEQHFSGPFETRFEGDLILARRGKKAAGRLLDGVLHDAYPEARS